MLAFKLKPGHANPTDGQLDAGGALDWTFRLVAGHANPTDGLLAAFSYLTPPAAVVDTPPGDPPTITTTIATITRWIYRAEARAV